MGIRAAAIVWLHHFNTRHQGFPKAEGEDQRCLKRPGLEVSPPKDPTGQTPTVTLPQPHLKEDWEIQSLWVQEEDSETESGDTELASQQGWPAERFGRKGWQPGPRRVGAPRDPCGASQSV